MVCAGALALVALIALDLVEVVPPKERFTKNVCLLLDRSSSVRQSMGDEDAIEVCKAISGQATDDMQVTGVAFGGQSLGYPGWIKLPDAKKQRDLVLWLAGIEVGRTTYVKPALTHAVSIDQDELTVVLISDGDFYNQPEELRKQVKSLQAWRKTKGLKPAVIACVGVGEVDEEKLKAVAEEGRGGLWKVVRPKPKKEPKKQPLPPPPKQKIQSSKRLKRVG